MSERKIKAVQYDLDGFLVDTSRFNENQIKAILKELSIPHSRAEIRKAMTRPWLECATQLIGEESDGLVETFMEKAAERLKKNISKIKVFPGVFETLTDHLSHGISVALVTNREKSTLDMILDETGLRRYCTTQVYWEMVANPKPHPEMALLACSILGIPPDQTAGGGDSPSDIACFRDARLDLTMGGAFGYFRQKEISRANPDHVVCSFKPIPEIINQGLRRVGEKPRIWR